MGRRKIPPEDDGRVLADMSGITPRRGSWPGERRQEPEQRQPEPALTRQERRWVVLGALKGTLLIAGAYLLGLGAVIALLLLLWR